MGSGGADGPAVRVETAEAPRAVPDGVMAVEMTAHEHAQAGTGSAAGLPRQLQQDETGGDDVIAGDDALVLDAEDLLEIDAPEGDKGRARIGGRAAELGVEGRQKVGPQIPVGGGGPRDAGHAEFADQAVCKVRLTRSLRPRAWGESPRMCSMPRRARARPTWVGRRRSGALPEVCARPSGRGRCREP